MFSSSMGGNAIRGLGMAISAWSSAGFKVSAMERLLEPPQNAQILRAPVILELSIHS